MLNKMDIVCYTIVTIYRVEKETEKNENWPV